MHNTTVGFTTLTIAALTLLVGFAVYIKNPKETLNLFFFLTSLYFSIWMVSNFYSNDLNLAPKAQLLINRFVFVSSLGAVGCLPALFRTFSGNYHFGVVYRLLRILTAITIMLCFTPLVVKSILPKEPVTEIIFGPVAPLYFATLLSLILMSIAIGISAASNLTGLKRARLSLIFASIFVSIFFGFITNVILPYGFSYFEATLYGPLFFFIMIIGFAYAIVFQRLFDVRLAVVRSLAYTLAVSVLAILFVVISVQTSSQLLGIDTSSEQHFIGVVSILFLLVIFKPVHGLFVRLTKKLFFRHGYDTQTVLGDLSGILVAQKDINYIAKSSLDLICGTLNPKSAYFIIIDNIKHRQFKSQNATELHLSSGTYDYINNFPKQVTRTEHIGDGDVREDCLENHIELVVKITNKRETIGLLLLGPRLRGDAYLKKDVDMLTISGKNIGLALSNAKQFEEIGNFNSTLQSKIADATNKLRKTNAQLKQLDKLRTGFISATSHQLRPQIMMASGYIDMVKDSNSSEISVEDKENLSRVKSSIDRMSRIVVHILESSLLSTKKITLNIESFLLSEVVNEELNQLSSNINSKNIVVNVAISRPEKIIEADKNKIKEAVYNLIDNAVKYSDEGGVIEVQVNTKHDEVEFIVGDSGIGIEDEDITKVFEKYYRAERAVKLQPTGTGVGLYVVKLFTEAHGGRVYVDSTPKGSKFGMTIPIEYQH